MKETIERSRNGNCLVTTGVLVVESLAAINIATNFIEYMMHIEKMAPVIIAILAGAIAYRLNK